MENEIGSNMLNTSDSVSSGYLNFENEVENTTRSKRRNKIVKIYAKSN